MREHGRLHPPVRVGEDGVSDEAPLSNPGQLASLEWDSGKAPESVVRFFSGWIRWGQVRLVAQLFA